MPAMRAALALLVVGSSLSIGYASQAAIAFDHALATRGCTQEDFPAIEIVLTRGAWDGTGAIPVPNIRIEVSGAPLDAQHDLQLTPLRRDPADPLIVRAALRAGDRLTWLTGTVRLRQQGNGTPVHGEYRFRADDGNVYQGTFDAQWRQRQVRCG
jgi:hypothetical protein